VSDGGVVSLGKVYQALFEYAQKEPLNQTEVADAVKTHLQPLMKATRALFGNSKL
jgi:hypothetical protein